MSYGIECYDSDGSLTFFSPSLTKLELAQITFQSVYTYSAPSGYKISDVYLASTSEFSAYAKIEKTDTSCSFVTYTAYNLYGQPFTIPPKGVGIIYGYKEVLSTGFGFVAADLNGFLYETVEEVVNSFYYSHSVTIPSPSPRSGGTFDGTTIVSTGISGSSPAPYILYSIPQVNRVSSGNQPARVFANLSVIDGYWAAIFIQGENTPSGTMLVFTKNIPTPGGYGIVIYDSNGNAKQVFNAKRLQSSILNTNSAVNGIQEYTSGTPYYTVKISITDFGQYQNTIYSDSRCALQAYVTHRYVTKVKLPVSIYTGLIHTSSNNVIATPFVGLDWYGNAADIVSINSSSTTHRILKLDEQEGQTIANGTPVFLAKQQDIGL